MNGEEKKKSKFRNLLKVFLATAGGGTAGTIVGDALNAFYTAAGVSAPFWATAAGGAALGAAFFALVALWEMFF